MIMKNERGITVVELLVALAITALIIGALVTVIFQIFDITNRGNSELVVQHDLQNAATWLNRDVLTASSAEVSGSQMVLTVPYSVSVGTVLTHTITYTFSAANGTLTRDSGDSPIIIARCVDSDPFPSAGTILAPNVVTVTLHSREGDVPGSGTFGLKMRAGGSIMAMHLCQVSGAESLGFDGSTVTWPITNTGGSATIEEIYIAWPSATNGALYGISFGEIPIWTGERGESPTTISSWLGPDEYRTISGEPKTLELIFQNPVSPTPTEYSINVTFDNGCTVSFNP